MIFNNNVQSVLKALNENNINYIIAGGYQRDIFFGRQPKDIDIFIYGDVDTNEVIKLISDYKKFNLALQEINESYNGDEFTALRLLGDQVDLNVIVVHIAQTATDVLNWFDFNLNQFILEVTQTNVTRSMCAKFVGDNFGELVNIKGQVNRVEKMRAIATQVGWKQ